MRYHGRFVEHRARELMRHFPIVAVLGARQAGKSTLVAHLEVDGLKTVVFDPVVDRYGAREDPDLFLQNQKTPLFLDEVQYVPEVLGALKRKVDIDRRPGQYIISGSQNLAVLRGVSESLAGRVAILNLLPMGLSEIEDKAHHAGFLRSWLFKKKFSPENWEAGPPRNIFKRLWRGGMPGILELPDDLVDDFFSSYLQTYVERDVRRVADIGQLQMFTRFFGLLAALTATEVNHNELGRELGVARKTALAWSQIASATYQWLEIPAYSRNAVKRIAGKAKGFLTDPGFACHLHRISSPDGLAAHPLAGQLFETWVAMEVKKRAETWPARPALCHFRAYSGAEVDLVLELNGTLHPIEVKLKTNPTRGDCRGFDGLRRTFPNTRIGRGLVVTACPEIRRLNPSSWSVPWWEL